MKTIKNALLWIASIFITIGLLLGLYALWWLFIILIVSTAIFIGVAMIQKSEEGNNGIT